MNKLIKFLFVVPILIKAQVADSIKSPVPQAADRPLRIELSQDGSRWFQVNFMNQTWVRYNRSNDGSTVKGNNAPETFDIGLRRTRIQMYGQITDRAFLYFQFGQNNFNYLSNNAGNRKLAAFFHDALCEYRVTAANQLKIGGGLTITNGLSRFSQPSVSSIATLDVPVFAQATVDQVDMFSRKLSIYARGQIGKFDYRFTVSDPFPISTSGTTPRISPYATYADSSHHKQYQGYVVYQFLEHEAHTTPYMTGTYLGAKKVFNVAAGAIYQSKATHRLGEAGQEVYEDMKLFALESFLDMPLNRDKQTAIHAYLGFFSYNFGQNYLRFNGIMNPSDGITGAGAISGAQGNAFPMMGTGQVMYAQLAYLLPKKWFGESNSSKVSVYGTSTINRFERIGATGGIHSVGFNWFINGHKAKVSAEIQNRPTYRMGTDGGLNFANRKSCFTLQYQIFI